jgi:hypothetical protein
VMYKLYDQDNHTLKYLWQFLLVAYFYNDRLWKFYLHLFLMNSFAHEFANPAPLASFAKHIHQVHFFMSIWIHHWKDLSAQFY